MAKTKVITTRLDPGVKEEVDKILNELGLSTSEAINLFFNQVRLHKGLPFEVSIPREGSIPKAKNGKGRPE
jgi:DNA-damage-inducible protein J